MARARFFRIYAVKARIQNQTERFRLCVEIENELDSLSGMTLNLVDLDGLLGRFQALQDAGAEFESELEFIQSAQRFWDAEIQTLGARLVRLDAEVWAEVLGYRWCSEQPHHFLRRWSSPACFRAGATELRAGVVTWVGPDEVCRDWCGPKMIERELRDLNEIGDAVQDLLGRASEVEFTDETTGESWGCRL